MFYALKLVGFVGTLVTVWGSVALIADSSIRIVGMAVAYHPPI